MWRKTLASVYEKSAPVTKVNNERIIIETYAYVIGNHSLSLLLIGYSIKARWFKNVKTLPLVCTNHKNMNKLSNICQMMWKQNIPEVKEKHRKIFRSENPNKCYWYLLISMHIRIQTQTSENTKTEYVK